VIVNLIIIGGFMGNLVGIIGEITLSSRPKNVKERGASGMSIEIPTST
jgi:hypothetical protein